MAKEGVDIRKSLSLIGDRNYDDALVYLIRSVSDPAQIYLGRTNDLRVRMADHNAGRSAHTAKFRPWTMVCYHAFADAGRAIEFEHYLKSGSGRAFRQRHFGV